MQQFTARHYLAVVLALVVGIAIGVTYIYVSTVGELRRDYQTLKVEYGETAKELADTVKEKGVGTLQQMDEEQIAATATKETTEVIAQVGDTTKSLLSRAKEKFGAKGGTILAKFQVAKDGGTEFRFFLDSETTVVVDEEVWNKSNIGDNYKE